MAIAKATAARCLRSSWPWFGTCLTALLCWVCALPGEAATFESRKISLDLQANGYLETKETLVRMETERDLGQWDRYPIYLDDDIELVEVSAEVLSAEGKVLEKVPRRKFESIDSPGDSLHNSGVVKQIPFSKLEVGHRIRVRTVTRNQPLFPAAWVYLAAEDKQLRLEVEVRGGGEQLRWHLRGDADQFRVSRSASGLEVVGEGLEGYARKSYSPSSGTAVPALQLSWGDQVSWSEVGDWYVDLIAEVPRDASELKKLAGSIIAGASTQRDKVDALSTYVKNKVRYEAVEIGRGKFVPSSSSEVMSRGWGDCKDKAEFLAGLLQEVGVPSYLALLRAGYGERIETDFPSPYQFNHAIVAVPTTGLELEPGDPVSGDSVSGYPGSGEFLFIDPTSAWGELAWLSTASQGRHALVVQPNGSRLVRTPEIPQVEGRRLTIEGEVSEAGTLEGKISYRLDGARSIPWIRDVEARPREATLADFLDVVHRVAPGAELKRAGWKNLETEVPGFALQGEFRLAEAVRGDTGRRWLRAPALPLVPEPSVLDERSEPVVLRPGTSMVDWRLRVPTGWCPAVESSETVENAVGKFSRTVSSPEAGVIAIRQTVTLAESWVEAKDFDALRALAVAETRAQKRRVRLRCRDEAR